MDKQKWFTRIEATIHSKEDDEGEGYDYSLMTVSRVTLREIEHEYEARQTARIATISDELKLYNKLSGDPECVNQYLQHTHPDQVAADAKLFAMLSLELVEAKKYVTSTPRIIVWARGAAVGDVMYCAADAVALICAENPPTAFEAEA